ncbi:MAG: late competence development ComFB family protein [Candidatus Omnitrophica bacterium]|nr:late competence development ComFB family protein [Candidatus Omnitrophota bacterium]
MKKPVKYKKILFNLPDLWYILFLMAEKVKNIVEDIVREYLNVSLSLRYDICTCPLCRNAMLAEALSNIPPKYVSTEEAGMRAVIEQTRLEYQARIAKEVLNTIDRISKNPPHELNEDKKQAFRLLLNKIYEDRGLDFRHYREGILKRRFALRMHANKVKSYAEYLLLLNKTPEEYEKLFEALCINVSEFFRDPPVWEVIEKILKELIKERVETNQSLKIWSAGCANGEEPYSIAILIKKILKDYPPDKFKGVEILATDIDKQVLRNGEKAEYSLASLKNVSPRVLKEYFTYEDGRYCIIPEIRKMVLFKHMDLILQEPQIKDLDIILCRNVFIYFNRSLQDILFTKFYKFLKSGGYLVLGKVETIWDEVKDIFEKVDLENRIFRKK